MTFQQAQNSLQVGTERTDQVFEGLEAYVGWLLTSPLFLAELNCLRSRWGDVIEAIGNIPAYPIRITDPQSRIRTPRGARDVTSEFASAFNSFFERWHLQGLPTWDLPEPRGANVSGYGLHPSILAPENTVTVHVPPFLPLPAKYLRSVVEESQHARMGSHLQGWLKVLKRQHARDLGLTRFRHMFLLHFYRDTVLASRYADRFAGHIEGLDRALGKFLGDLGEESVKKLRVNMEALRRPASEH
jgi:hypothetical protein